MWENNFFLHCHRLAKNTIIFAAETYKIKIMDVTFLLFFGFLASVVICLTGAYFACKDSKENKNGSYSDYSSFSDMYSHDRPRYKKPTRRERSSWQDEYNRGHKAGREDALFNDGYG